MKDKHIVNLILVFSRWFHSFLQSSFVVSILDSSCSPFFSGVASFLGCLVMKLHLYHCKASILFASTFNSFMLSFPIRSSSWRLNMVVRKGFLSFFNCPAKLYSKISMVFNTCLVLRSSSILHLPFWSAILSILSFEVVVGVKTGGSRVGGPELCV